MIADAMLLTPRFPIAPIIMTKTFNVITINRTKEVVRTITVSKWMEAINKVYELMREYEGDGFHNFPKGEWSMNFSRRNSGTYTTSFGSVKGKKDEGGEYFFTYIKSVEAA